MTNFKNPIPAILVHQDGRNEYRISGKIYAINESNNTVSMKIKGRTGIEHDIPMESVYLTEGILDSIKKAGRAIAKGVKYLIRKVKGLLLPVNENGKVDYSYVNAPINLCALEAQGELPPYVHFYPNADMIAEAEANGIKLANVGIGPEDTMAVEDAKTIEKYWSYVMKEYVANESYSVSDAVKSINEKYVSRYNNSHKVSYGKSRLNEAVMSLHNPGYNPDKYGPELSTEEIIAKAMLNIEALLEREIGDPRTVSPILIWGAPGIGKTTIIKGICDRIKEELGINLNFQVIQCSSLNTEDWGIPALKEFHGIKEQYATNVPKQWLPVYAVTGDDEEDKRRDDVYNSGQFQNKNNSFDGGIVFFDELTRLPHPAKNNMMALVDLYMYEDMHVASKWCFIFASNRLEDVRYGEEEDYIWEAALSDRFTHVTFVPKRKEWLDWARSVNKATGRQNIDERFVAFIEQSPEGVWYDALDFGSRDNVLSSEDKKVVSDYSTGKTDPEQVEDLLNKESLKGMLVWSGRTWEARIQKEEDRVIKSMFRRHPELYDYVYTEKGLDMVKLELALDMLSPAEWEKFAGPWRERIDPAGHMNRITFYNEYVQLLFGNNFGQDGLPTTEWRTYNEYKSIFIPPVVEHIWKTGKMPAKYEEDDNIVKRDAGEYVATSYSKWKAQLHLVENVLDIIIGHYPGGYTEAAKQIMAEDQYNNNAPMSDATAAKLFDKFQKEFTITVGNKKIPTLFKGNEDYTRPDIISMLRTLENSEFARNLAHIAAYATKIAIQNKNNTVITHVNKWFNSLAGEFYQNIKKANPKAYEMIFHTNDLKDVINDDKARNLLIAKLLCAPNMLILSNAGNRNIDFAKNGHN